MNGFLTLIRRDLADNRGALIWTPVIIAAVILAITLLASLSGNSRFGMNPEEFERSSTRAFDMGGDGSFTVTLLQDGKVVVREPGKARRTFEGAFEVEALTADGPVTASRGADGAVRIVTPRGEETLAAPENGFRAQVQTEDGDLTIKRDAQGRLSVTSPDGEEVVSQADQADVSRKVTQVIPVATGVAGGLPLGVAAVVVLFLLAGSLHDERKDRSILFWKSMPVSDLETVVSKLVTIVPIGFAIAFAAGAVLHLALNLVATVSAARFGLAQLDFAAQVATIVQLWGLSLVGALVYVGWALPVYAWFLLASAAAPKAPFLVAMAPIVLAPLLSEVLELPGQEAFVEPLSRLVGASAVGDHFGRLDAIGDDGAIPVADLMAGFGASVSQPGFWIGLLVAAGLVFAAAEVRRRRSW